MISRADTKSLVLHTIFEHHFIALPLSLEPGDVSASCRQCGAYNGACHSQRGEDTSGAGHQRRPSLPR